jgi:hypothetical protein
MSIKIEEQFKKVLVDNHQWIMKTMLQQVRTFVGADDPKTKIDHFDLFGDQCFDPFFNAPIGGTSLMELYGSNPCCISDDLLVDWVNTIWFTVMALNNADGVFTAFLTEFKVFWGIMNK